MNPKSLFPFLLLTSAFFFTSCDKVPLTFLEGNWLVGQWTVDKERSMEAFRLNNQKATPAGGIAGEIAASAIRKTMGAMIKPIEDMTITFTDTEYIERAAGYSNKPKTYEIVSRPGPNQIKTLDSNDAVRIYHREGDHIWFYFDDNERLQIYLKPVVQ
ncbi:MAG: hypothetical protein P1U89_12280 [Verrucomicrobiales bacterium]|nr:hypothetical protein [Verrucomicrobiales bacterium]